MEWKEIGCNKEEIISKEIEQSAMDTTCIRGGLFLSVSVCYSVTGSRKSALNFRAEIMINMKHTTHVTGSHMHTAM